MNMATATSQKSSQRANSRKSRVYTFHAFLRQTYPTAQHILDVAGGRGDLSFVLHNVNGVDSIIADPRTPCFNRIINSIHYLVRHPKEAEIRSIEGLSTHQPLAKLIPSLMERQTCMNVNVDTTATAYSQANSSIQLAIPKNLRIDVDHHLVNAIRDVITITNDDNNNNGKERIVLLRNNDLTLWDEYWKKEGARIASSSNDNTSHYGGTAPKGDKHKEVGYESNAIHDSRDALKEFKMLDLIVGFHPDQVRIIHFLRKCNNIILISNY